MSRSYSRLLTVTGDVKQPGNFQALIGTPVYEILDHLGINLQQHSLIMGGPMMGVEVTDWNVPVSKTSNCILLRERQPQVLENACIRCDRCAEVCPVGLQAQALFEFARGSDFDAIQDYHLFDCIECGCCAHVCPSNIPLVHHYRHAKSEIQALDHERARARSAHDRFISRTARLNDTHAERAPFEQAQDSGDEKQQAIQSYIQGAVQRTRQRRRDQS